MNIIFGVKYLISFFIAFFGIQFVYAQSIQTVGQESENKDIYKIQSFTHINWNGPITPATIEHIRSGITKVNQSGALIIELNTPGGLVSSMKDILQIIGEANAPIIVWIYPVGASATSAGAFIAIGSHAVYMSQGSNIGAATPVSLNGDIDKTPPQESPPSKQSSNKIDQTKQSERRNLEGMF